MGGRIQYAVHDGVCVLKLIGELACTAPDSVALSRALERFVDHVENEHAVKRFVVDLTETDYVDSTNLGILARIARRAAERGEEKPHIITTRPAITRTLETMGFRHLFTLIDHEEDVPEPEADLPGIPASEQGLARTILRAHRDLASLNTKNAETFRPVIELLERELGQSRER